MDLGIALGTLIVFALALAVGGGFLAARFLTHAARQWPHEADSRDR